MQNLRSSCTQGSSQLNSSNGLSKISTWLLGVLTGLR